MLALVASGCKEDKIGRGPVVVGGGERKQRLVQSVW